MSKVHKIAGFRISRVEPVICDFVPSRDLLPDLEPAEERLRREKSRIFSADSISLSHESAVEDVLEPRLRSEHNDITARLTVYIMNMIVMVMYLPAGLALLAFNIICGENLRTTAHVIALCGLGMALHDYGALTGPALF